MRFEWYEKNGEFRVRWVAANNEIVWTAPQRYNDKRDAMHAIELLQTNAATSPVVEVEAP